MSYNHVVVWLDHKEAHVFHFDSESTRMEAIKTRSNQLHLHHKRGSVGSGKLGGNADYLREVMDAVQADNEILVVGPGSAKNELIDYIGTHDLHIAKKIIGVETVDHPTDGQLLAFAKKYFLKADMMRKVHADAKYDH